MRFGQAFIPCPYIGHAFLMRWGHGFEEMADIIERCIGQSSSPGQVIIISTRFMAITASLQAPSLQWRGERIARDEPFHYFMETRVHFSRLTSSRK
jgi:hypothetical protein